MKEFNKYCYIAECEEHSEEWHDLRSKGIGGSDAASVVGMNKYRNNVELWQLKTGRIEQEDLSNNDAVVFGSKAEDPMRQIYSLKHKKEVIKLEGTLISKQFPFIRVNLDGYIPSDNGIWEGKTATVHSFDELKKWFTALPHQYYLQCIHALFVTGADYIDLSALVYLAFSTTATVAQLFEYRIKRKDVIKDSDLLIKEECIFWDQVQNDEEPFLKISY